MGIRTVPRAVAMPVQGAEQHDELVAPLAEAAARCVRRRAAR